MPDASLMPPIPVATGRPASDIPRTPEAEQAQGPRIVPAFRFVPSAAPVLADAGGIVADYARAARAAGGLHNAAPTWPGEREADPS